MNFEYLKKKYPDVINKTGGRNYTSGIATFRKQNKEDTTNK